MEDREGAIQLTFVHFFYRGEIFKFNMLSINPIFIKFIYIKCVFCHPLEYFKNIGFHNIKNSVYLLTF